MRKTQRPFRPPTPETLAKTAAYYLSRYAASESSLRRVLENRLRRAAMRDREFAADKALQQQLRRGIEDIIARHKKSGTLNDIAYAETKINSLRRAGRSARAIQRRLGHAGVDREIIKKALAGGEDDLDPVVIETRAAMVLARRKRLGPFRAGKSDFTLYRKDLATLARAGFSLAIAREVLGGQGLAGDDAEDGGAFSAK